MNESEGTFSYEEWEEACELAEDLCSKEEGGVGLGEGMEVDEQQGNMESWLRDVVKRKVAQEQRWRTGD